MPKFIILSNWEGKKGAESEPEVIESVGRDVKKRIEENGGTVVMQYSLEGKYDFLSFVEAPSFVSVTQALMPLNTDNNLKTLTMPATDLENLQ